MNQKWMDFFTICLLLWDDGFSFSSSKNVKVAGGKYHTELGCFLLLQVLAALAGGWLGMFSVQPIFPLEQKK